MNTDNFDSEIEVEEIMRSDSNGNSTPQTSLIIHAFQKRIYYPFNVVVDSTTYDQDVVVLVEIW